MNILEPGVEPTRLQIENPKRNRKTHHGRAAWYPYYAGFSPLFAKAILASAALQQDALVMDPWNGAGTTTASAAALGLRTRGYDLNPVMVMTAKGRMLKSSEALGMPTLLRNIVQEAIENSQNLPSDTLSVWFVPKTCRIVRGIDQAIRRLFIDQTHYAPLINLRLGNISDLACFFYTALFRTVRTLATPFIGSNPTWIKKPDPQHRLAPESSAVLDQFEATVMTMVETIDNSSGEKLGTDVVIEVASSRALPLLPNSVDFILTSPPYCTRIDYAVATLIELAVMGVEMDEFTKLRRELIGNAMVPASVDAPSEGWGRSCMSFLAALGEHRSKASKTYYYKNHVQYFDAIFRSFAEIGRTLKERGSCVIVAQDSYYKDLHNPLPSILVEMAQFFGLACVRRDDFVSSRTMAHVHPGVRQYRNSSSPMESVLCFEKS